MMAISTALVIFGALIMAGGMVWYYRLLVYMRSQIYEKKTFNHWVYGASFTMIAFFLAGYIYVLTLLLLGFYEYHFFPVSVILFFGAIFVLCMVGVQHKMASTISEKTLGTIRSMIVSIEAKDAYTKGHSEHVYKLAELIYSQMPNGLRPQVNLTKLKDAALLHDIGKIGIPDSILNKPGKLTGDEYEIIKQHPRNGKAILENTSYREICDMVLYHHERMDGNGYYGIPRNKIPVEAKIIAIADTFSALYTDRSYRKKLPFDTAISIIKEAEGSQFDPELAEVFCKIERDAIEKTGAI